MGGPPAQTSTGHRSAGRRHPWSPTRCHPTRTTNGFADAVVQPRSPYLRSSPPRKAYADESVGPDVHVGVDAGCCVRTASRGLLDSVQPVRVASLRALIRRRDRARGAPGRESCAGGDATDREPRPRRVAGVRDGGKSRGEGVGAPRAGDPDGSDPRRGAADQTARPNGVQSVRPPPELSALVAALELPRQPPRPRGDDRARVDAIELTHVRRSSTPADVPTTEGLKLFRRTACLTHRPLRDRPCSRTSGSPFAR